MSNFADKEHCDGNAFYVESSVCFFNPWTTLETSIHKDLVWNLNPQFQPATAVIVICPISSSNPVSSFCGHQMRFVSIHLCVR